MSTSIINKIEYSGNIYNLQDTTSGYTSNVGTISGLKLDDINIANSGTANLTLSLLINTFYPVGSYYESSNASFSPSAAGWPGTWQLEAEGITHVSSGANYTMDGTTKGSARTPYTPAGTLSSVSLTTDQVPSHDHGSGGSACTLWVRRYGTSSSGGTIYQNVWSGSNTTIAQATSSQSRIIATGRDSVSNYRDSITLNNAHTHTSIGSGSAHTHTFTGTAVSDGGFDTYQAYVSVNRWHRIS